MTDEQRENKILEIIKAINELRPDWLYIGLKIKTENFEKDDNIKELNAQWNDIDRQIYNLESELRNLQVDYEVQYFNSERISVTSRIRMNVDLEFDTFTNGWEPYINSQKHRKLIIDIYNLIGMKPELMHIRKTHSNK